MSDNDIVSDHHFAVKMLKYEELLHPRKQPVGKERRFSGRLYLETSTKKEYIFPWHLL